MIYNSMKKLIGKMYYKTAEEAQERLDGFFAVGRMRLGEYTELTALVQEVYGEAVMQ